MKGFDDTSISKSTKGVCCTKRIFRADVMEERSCNQEMAKNLAEKRKPFKLYHGKRNTMAIQYVTCPLVGRVF